MSIHRTVTEGKRDIPIRPPLVTLSGDGQVAIHDEDGGIHGHPQNRLVKTRLVVSWTEWREKDGWCSYLCTSYFVISGRLSRRGSSLP